MTTRRCQTTLLGFGTPAIVLGGLFAVAFAAVATGEDVPTIDISPSCKATAAGYAGLAQEFDSCVRSEHAARDILVKQWSSFPAADRTSCHRLTTTGTPGTYTELLTCLEMRRDARALPTAEEINKAEPPRRSKPKTTREN